MGHPLLSRHTHTSAGTIKRHAMISAFQVVTDNAAHRKGQLAMRTGVLQCGRLTILFSENHNFFTQHFNLPRCARDIVIPACDIPTVFHEHLLHSVFNHIRTLN